MKKLLLTTVLASSVALPALADLPDWMKPAYANLGSNYRTEKALDMDVDLSKPHYVGPASYQLCVHNPDDVYDFLDISA